MKQIERIRNLPMEYLAELLIADTYNTDVDYDWEDHPYMTYEEVYKCPNGSIYWDYDEALEYTMEWLESEVGENDVNLSDS